MTPTSFGRAPCLSPACRGCGLARTQAPSGRWRCLACERQTERRREERRKGLDRAVRRVPLISAPTVGATYVLACEPPEEVTVTQIIGRGWARVRWEGETMTVGWGELRRVG